MTALFDALRQRIRAGIDWGRSGPWPPDAVTALDELFGLLAEGGNVRGGRRLTIIGRDLQIIDTLAKRLQKVLRTEHDYTELRDTPDMRGRTFEVKLENGRVARVTVELDRVEFPTESVGFLGEESHKIGEQARAE